MKVCVVFLLTLVLLLAALINLQAQPSPKEGKPVIRVMSYNVHHCNPPSKPGQIDIQAVAQTIQSQNPDLVALQEIDVHTGRSGPHNQAEELGKLTGLTPYFFKAIDHDGGAYGIAILSRFPVKESKQYPLPTLPETKGEPRILATVSVSLPGGQSLLFACTHMDALKQDANRVLQIKEIIKVLGQSSIPVILAGDLNDVPESKTITLLDEKFERSCLACEPTIPVNEPRKVIDFVAFTPKGKFTVQKHRVIPERYASDHLPVMVELSLK